MHALSPLPSSLYAHLSAPSVVRIVRHLFRRRNVSLFLPRQLADAFFRALRTQLRPCFHGYSIVAVARCFCSIVDRTEDFIFRYSFPILFLASLVKCSTKRGFYLHRYRTALDPCLYPLDLGDFANGPRFQHFDIAAKRICHGGGFNASNRNNFHLLRLPRRNSGFRETRSFLRDIHSRRGLVRSEYETTRWREHIEAGKTLPKGINFSFMRRVSSQRDTLCSFLLLLGFPIASRLPLSKSSDYTLSYSR